MSKTKHIFRSDIPAFFGIFAFFFIRDEKHGICLVSFFLSAAQKYLYAGNRISTYKKKKIQKPQQIVCFYHRCGHRLLRFIPLSADRSFQNGTEMRYSLLRIESICEGWSNGYFPVRVNPLFLTNYVYGQSLTSPTCFDSAFLRRLGLRTYRRIQSLYLPLRHALLVHDIQSGVGTSQKSRYGGLIAAATVVLFAVLREYAFSTARRMKIIFRSSSFRCGSPVFTIFFYREYKNKMDILFRYARALLFKRASVRYDVYSEHCAVLRLRSRFQKETENFLLDAPCCFRLF